MRYIFPMASFQWTTPKYDLDNRQAAARRDNSFPFGIKRRTVIQVASVTAILYMCLTDLASAEPFRSDSKRLKNATMDIVVTETERPPRTSVIAIQIKTIGSSVGASSSLLCSVRDLAQQHGHNRYIAKVEGQPSHDHMSIGFLRSSTEAPEQLNPRLTGQPVIDLQQFSPICDKMQ